MNAAAARRLLDLNREFYERFGAPFSATRRRVQPGVARFMQTLAGDESILDLGCGNGGFARALAARGQRGRYLGLDSSAVLLQEAARQALPFPHGFVQADLTAGDWPLDTSHWSLITAFAVLHHIPGEELRLKIVRRIAGLLEAAGRFVISNWQFMGSPRLRERIQPWSRIGLTDADVDESDYLLDWRNGGAGLRYVHHFSAGELDELAERAGLRVKESYVSDGAKGDLAIYQIWELQTST